MKNVVILFTATIFCFACRKRPVEYSRLRLTQLKKECSSGGALTADFSYDDSGRISSQTLTPGVIYYPDGAILISTITENGHDTAEVKYGLDTDKKPLQRTALSKQHFYYGTSTPEDHYTHDISNYHYNSDGIMSGYEGVQTDTMTYYPYPNVLSIVIKKAIYKLEYKIENNNIKQLDITFEQDGKEIESGKTKLEKLSATETIVFSYEKNYPNRFDFNNAVLMKELELLPFPLYQLNAKLANYPNRIVTTKIVKDETGNIVSNETTTEDADLLFTDQGFIQTRRDGTCTGSFVYVNY